MDEWGDEMKVADPKKSFQGALEVSLVSPCRDKKLSPQHAR